MTSQISITRALATIKILNTQVEEYFKKTRVFAGITLGDKQIVADGFTLEQLRARIQADHDGIDTLIAKRHAIKAAVIKSNAVTIITLGGKSYTVAEAVLLKSSVPLKEQTLQKYKSALLVVQNALAGQKAEFDKRVDAVYGASVSTATTAEEAAKIMKMVREEQTKILGPAFYDPLNLVGKIDALEKEINDIKLELDFVLSESNTRTLIDVDM